MNSQSRREYLSKVLIEQELSTQTWEQLMPNIPVEATPHEALIFARAQLEKEYAAIELEDLETLYNIFIAHEEIQEPSDSSLSFFETMDRIAS